VFVANRSSYDYSDTALSFAELSALPILMLSKRSTTSEFLHEQFLSHSVELAPAVELSSNDLLIDLAKIGLGIAFVPDSCALDHADIRFIPIQNWHQALYMCIYYDKWLEPPVWEFVELLVNAIRESHSEALDFTD
jgi:DNA-binding transcriptional LysR family regulator